MHGKWKRSKRGTKLPDLIETILPLQVFLIIRHMLFIEFSVLGNLRSGTGFNKLEIYSAMILLVY